MSDAENTEAARSERLTVTGTVMSNKMDKTIVVRRDRKVMHPLYKKYIKRSSKYVAHDADNAAHIGDEVEITQTRPLSKTKRWRLVRITREAPRSIAAPAAESTAVEEA